jgi:cell division protein FtsN
MVEMRYVIASYPTSAEAEAARATLAGAGIRADVLPPSPRWTARLSRALRGAVAQVRVGVAPAEVDRAREHLGVVPGCRDRAS